MSYHPDPHPVIRTRPDTETFFSECAGEHQIAARQRFVYAALFLGYLSVAILNYELSVNLALIWVILGLYTLILRWPVIRAVRLTREGIYLLSGVKRERFIPISSGRLEWISVRDYPIEKGGPKGQVSLRIRHNGWLGKVPLLGILHHLEFVILKA